MRQRIQLIFSVVLVATLFTSCFTGIESTPRISSGDVRKRDAAVSTPEQLFLSDVHPQRPSEWQSGKRFYITDDKVSIIFQSQKAHIDSLTGKDLVFSRFENVPSVTGTGATVLVFNVNGYDGEMRYHINFPIDDIMSRDRLEVPFSVERSVIEKVDSAMRGNDYYISTPKWFAAGDNHAVPGRRHIPVKITHVEPGTYIYPLRVFFVPTGTSEEYWIPMTIGDDKASTRNFSTVFNFENPRKRYPQITDETWELIINSRVTNGMTRDECRLALGAPNSYRTIPVYNAVVEQWSYDDGLYLIFEDGILTRYRI
ncbi:MAG: DUF2845 domain-containing protein [Muribaculaceae bacterium]|nr:DUF2845 domain-containing protein [Muribaculaceae bacterium]